METDRRKRKSISHDDAIEALYDYKMGIFNAYENAVKKYNEEILQTIPEARTRLNSVLLNSKITESFILEFPDKWIKGKYGRILFRLNGIQLLIKKLDKFGKPSYVPTKLSEDISMQYQTPLFEGDADSAAEPILFFGYTKGRGGVLVDPRIVYYDGEVQWIIQKGDLTTSNSIYKEKQIIVKPKKKGEIKKVE